MSSKSKCLASPLKWVFMCCLFKVHMVNSPDIFIWLCLVFKTLKQFGWAVGLTSQPACLSTNQPFSVLMSFIFNHISKMRECSRWSLRDKMSFTLCKRLHQQGVKLLDVMSKQSRCLTQAIHPPSICLFLPQDVWYLLKYIFKFMIFKPICSSLK